MIMAYNRLKNASYAKLKEIGGVTGRGINVGEIRLDIF